MKNVKKHAAIVLLFALLLTLLSCGGDTATTTTTSTTTTTTTTTTTVTTTTPPKKEPLPIPAGAQEITDASDRLVNIYGTYDAASGWTGEAGENYIFFFLSLEDGEMLHFDLSAEASFQVYMIGDPNAAWQTAPTYLVQGSGMYMVIADQNVQLKVYLQAAPNGGGSGEIELPNVDF